jgi:hypothetical protein
MVLAALLLPFCLKLRILPQKYQKYFRSKGEKSFDSDRVEAALPRKNT